MMTLHRSCRNGHRIFYVIMSFTADEEFVTLGPFRPSLISLLKTDKFWVNLSLFLVSKFLSIPSIRFSNHVIMLLLLSVGCEDITWSRKLCAKIFAVEYLHNNMNLQSYLEVFLIEKDQS